jgi:mycothiol synthase
MRWDRRTFRTGDDEALVALWNRVLTRDPISPGAFRRQTLLDPNFLPEGCLIAESEGQAVGFALAMAPRTAGRFTGRPGSGRIAGLGVLPQARRQGIGTALLEGALAFLKEHGCSLARVAAPEYYAAGVDREAYGEGIAFLNRRGFVEVGEAVAMGRQLYDLSWPDDVRASEAALQDAGIVVRAFEPRDTYALAEYFRAEFPTWVEFFSRKLDAGDDHDTMVIALDTRGAGRVVGYCQHLDTDHVGPFGVAQAYRNRGIGSVMLYRLLDALRQKGYKFAWFGETGRAQPYSERAGFRVTRTYTILRRDL